MEFVLQFMNPHRPADQAAPEKFLNALAENYLLQDAILDASELAVISTKPNGVIASMNRAGEQLLGYVADELIGRTSLSVFHDPEELERRSQELSNELGISISSGIESLVAKARLFKTADRQEWTYVTKTGFRFPVMLSVSGIRNEQDELVGFLGIATDITDQKKVELARRESEQKFKILAENIQGTIYLCRNDATYSMIYLNDQVIALTGYSAEEFIKGTVNFVQLYHPDDQANVFEIVENAIQRKESFHLQYRILHRSGEWRWIDEAGIGICQGDELLMRQGYLIDITARKKAELELKQSKENLEVAAQELQEQNRQLNEFAHIISHNLRSPVGNIGVLVSLLNEHSSLEDYQTIFEKLRAASSNLQDTLNDLMETLTIKRQNQVERVTLSFEDVFTKIKQDLAGEIIKCNAEVTFDFSACRQIAYSKTYLESIFLNLLSNPIKYRSPARTLKVHVETFLQHGKIIMRVTDNALGIDLKHHGDKLFNLRKTFHDHKDARGVGLFLTRTQVESMGGRISATSEVDRGSVFIVQFS